VNCLIFLPFAFEYAEIIAAPPHVPSFNHLVYAGNIMDNVDHCRRQAQECRRLLQQPQSTAQAQVLKNLCNSWVRLANQTDLYAEIVRRERSPHWRFRVFASARRGRVARTPSVGQHGF
jgi:branched-subunit amino acid aminotransferase/4-amino-4-deoxychorismate lyase